MAKTAVVIIVVLFNLLFSSPDPMLSLLPVLAEGSVIILFAVTEENSDFLVRPSKIWILEYDPFNCFSSKLGCVYCCFAVRAEH